jgi:uncharacterized protein (DUF305 family)
MLTDERALADPAPGSASGHGPAVWQVVVLVVALCFLAGVVGWWLNEPDDESFGAVDVGFLSDMEIHHNGAIALGFACLDREHDPLVGHFAREIVVSQSQEIAAMNDYLHRAGNRPSAADDVAMEWMGHPVRRADMPGMPTDAEAAALADATGAAADDRFTHLMIRHHAAGAAMAEYAATRRAPRAEPPKGGTRSAGGVAGRAPRRRACPRPLLTVAERQGQPRHSVDESHPVDQCAADETISGSSGSPPGVRHRTTLPGPKRRKSSSTWPTCSIRSVSSRVASARSRHRCQRRQCRAAITADSSPAPARSSARENG